MYNQRQITIGYLSGPVDGAEVYDLYLRNHGTDYLGTSYLQEFFQVCDRLGVRSHVITSQAAPPKRVEFANTTIVNRPKPLNTSGFTYHRGLINWTRAALKDLEDASCDAVVMTDAQNYWFLVRQSAIRNAALIPALHCAIRTSFSKVALPHRILHWLTGRFFYSKYPNQVLVASPLIARQVSQSLGGNSNVDLFLPTYLSRDFASVIAFYPDNDANVPFRIISAGRIEHNKGVFDLVDMMEELRDRCPRTIILDICGEGSVLSELRKTVVEKGLENLINIHGYCGKSQMLELMRNCHAVIVPTRSTFEEGFAMICCEAIIAGRPLVTSKVCPALELLKDAALEAEMDDPTSYASAIQTLALQPNVLAEKRIACDNLRMQFLDANFGYGVKLVQALRRELTSKLISAA